MNRIVWRIAWRASRTWLVADSSSGRWWTWQFIVQTLEEVEVERGWCDYKLQYLFPSWAPENGTRHIN